MANIIVNNMLQSDRVKYFSFIVFTALGFFGSSAIAILAFAVFGLGNFLSRNYNEAFDYEGIINLASQVFTYGVTILAIMLIWLNKKQQTETKYILGNNVKLSLGARFLVANMAALLSCAMVLFIVSVSANSGERVYLTNYTPIRFFQLVIAAFIEEYIFRVLYFKVLPDTSSRAIILNAVAFAIVHFKPGYVLSLVIVSSVMIFLITVFTISLVYTRIKSYFAAVLVHLAINIAIFYYENIEKFSRLVDRGIVVLILLGICAAVILFRLLKRKSMIHK
ncbi:MAG: hypothetical protein A2Y35_08820 [Spirochaetes bacterium GWE1_60_18]|nr:MAG: hypothetical protein A2Y35_08820 [Spirochaetes bacterium GWE1_60_18]